MLLASASLSLVGTFVGCGEAPPGEPPADGGGGGGGGSTSGGGGGSTTGGGGGSTTGGGGGASTGGGAGSLPVTVDWARVCPRSAMASNGKLCVIVPSREVEHRVAYDPWPDPNGSAYTPAHDGRDSTRDILPGVVGLGEGIDLDDDAYALQLPDRSVQARRE